MSNQEIILASRPKGLPDLSIFKFQEAKTPSLADDQVKVQGLYYSVDPYMRGRMNEGKSYVPPFALNQTIQGGVVAQVLDSKSARFKQGDVIVGYLPWSEISVVNAKDIQKIPAEHASLYLGLLGMPGFTAYFGLNLAEPKAGETIVVSGAAGAVGSTVGQLAKIKKLRVIGIAGSDEKCSLLKKEFGFDEAVNYKTNKNIHDSLKAVCPNGVDVYFDNVGGEISDAVLTLMNDFGRISICGQIAHYNAEKPPVGPRIEPLLLTRKLRMQGFIVSDFQDRFPEAQKALEAMHANGLLKTHETIIKGFEQLPNALLGLFTGQNTGKMIVQAHLPNGKATGLHS